MDIKKIGQNIAYLRKRAGFTQKSLAERIGISDKAVSKWERGFSLPDIAYISKLALLLDSDAESLLAGDGIHQSMSWGGLLILDENPNGVWAGTTIYDKPLVYYLIGYFLLAGIQDIVVSCAPKDKNFIISEFADGSRLGIKISFIPLLEGYEPHENNDLSDAFLDAVNCSNVMVVYGRTFLYGAGITRSFRMAMTQTENVTVMSMPCVASAGSMELNFNENKQVVPLESIEKLNTQYNYREIPIFFCPRQLLASPFLNRIYYVEPMERGEIEQSMDSLDDVCDVSTLVRILQKSSNMPLYCLEEIALRRGMIGVSVLKNVGHEKHATEYGKYMLALCK